MTGKIWIKCQSQSQFRSHCKQIESKQKYDRHRWRCRVNGKEQKNCKIKPAKVSPRNELSFVIKMNARLMKCKLVTLIIASRIEILKFDIQQWPFVQAGARIATDCNLNAARQCDDNGMCVYVCVCVYMYVCVWVCGRQSTSQQYWIRFASVRCLFREQNGLGQHYDFHRQSSSYAIVSAEWCSAVQRIA